MTDANKLKTDGIDIMQILHFKGLNVCSKIMMNAIFHKNVNVAYSKCKILTF